MIILELPRREANLLSWIAEIFGCGVEDSKVNRTCYVAFYGPGIFSQLSVLLSGGMKLQDLDKRRVFVEMCEEYAVEVSSDGPVVEQPEVFYETY